MNAEINPLNPPFAVIRDPAKCVKCGQIVHSPTTGVVGNKCYHCGGEIVSVALTELNAKNAAGSPHVSDVGSQEVTVETELREALKGKQRLIDFVRWNCRVVFYPPSPAYPIEHTMGAKKDMWDWIVKAEEDSRAALLPQPTHKGKK